MDHVCTLGIKLRRLCLGYKLIVCNDLIYTLGEGFYAWLVQNASCDFYLKDPMFTPYLFMLAKLLPEKKCF